MKKRKPNLLILGASGGVANALLHYLVHHRDFFDKLILLDKRKKVLSDPYIDHKGLNYKFIHKELVLPEKEKEYIDILKKEKINIVLDITDYKSVPIIEATDKTGVTCINTGMNQDDKTVTELMLDIYKTRNKYKNAVHLLCTGMNPGVANMWAVYGMKKFGKPKEIIEFEYDTSRISGKWHPMMTWSPHEFLEEVVNDPAGLMNGKDKAIEFNYNALKKRIDMTPILKPIMKLDKYPKGFLVVHEEMISMSEKYDVPSKYIYAVHMRTMEALEEIYKKKKKITIHDLPVADNTHEILDGCDNIGVLLKYPDKDVYYFNKMPNVSSIGTNATYIQVITGICSGLFTIMFDDLKKGLYFVEDLYDTHYKDYLFDNMRVEEFVFKKGKLTHFNPWVRIKHKHQFIYL